MVSELSPKTKRKLKFALAHGSLSKVRGYFLRHRDCIFQSVTKNSLNLLHIACMENRLDVLQMATEEFGADLAAEDQWGNALVSWAKVFRNEGIVRFIESKVGGRDQGVNMTLGETNFRLSNTELTSHYEEQEPKTLICKTLSAKYLLRIYKRQLPAVMHLMTGNGEISLSYALKKGYLTLETIPLVAYLTYFNTMRMMKEFESLVKLIPDALISEIFPSATISSPDLLLEKFADKIPKETLLHLAKTWVYYHPLRRVQKHCLNQATFALLPQLLPAYVFQRLERYLPTAHYVCRRTTNGGACRGMFELLVKTNRHKTEFLDNIDENLRNLIRTCLHENGCLQIFSYLKTQELLPSHKVSLNNAEVNLILNIDMIAYSRLLEAHFQDYKVTFQFKCFPTVPQPALLSALAYFDTKYPIPLKRDLDLQIESLVLACFRKHRTMIPFFMYLSNRYNLDAIIGTSRLDLGRGKKTLKLKRILRWKSALGFVYVRSKVAYIRRLPMSLTRYIWGFM